MEDDNLSGPSFAENQKERAGTGNYGKLWVQAYNALEADKKSATLMEGYKALLNGNLKQEDKNYRDPAKQDLMAGLVEEKLKVMAQKQWTLPWGKTSFVVREQAEKIVKVVQKFSGIGTVAASLDPAHAGIAWAGVCVLLPVSNTAFTTIPNIYEIGNI